MTVSRRQWRRILAAAIFIVAIVVLVILYPRAHVDVPVVIATEVKPKISMKTKPRPVVIDAIPVYQPLPCKVEMKHGLGDGD